MAKLIPGAFISEKIYIPRDQIKLSRVKKHYEFRMFKEDTCKKCEVFQNGERFNDICASCPAYQGLFQLWDTVVKNGKKYVTVHKGNIAEVEKLLKIDLSKADDRRSAPKMKNKFKILAKLFKNDTEKVEGGVVKRVNQVRLIKKFLEDPNGTIQAPPRAGKTLIGTVISRALRVRTLVIAHESTLLDQFLATIRNPKFTNVRELEKESGKKIVGIVNDMSDFNKGWDIVLCTYQKFLRGKKGQKRIKKYIRDKFGLLIIDESHLCAAPCFSKFAANINTKYVLGLSATPERKDGMERIVEKIIGPVKVKGKAVGMIPEVEVHDTKFAPPTEWKGGGAYTKAVTWSANNMERNKMLVRQVFADLRADKRHNIIIPIERTQQARVLVEMIKRQAEINNSKRGEKWDRDLARAYIGGVNKKSVIKDMTHGGTRVLIATRKMCKLGLNIEALTHMYLQTPINNAPDFWQLTQRICTVYPNKPQPVVRFFVDDIGIYKGCFSATWWNGVVARKYKVSRITMEKAKLIIASRNGGSSYRKPSNNPWSGRYTAGGFRQGNQPIVKKVAW